MCSTACCTDFAPGRPSWAYSAACVGRSRAMPNSTATKKPLSATRTNARTIRAAVTRAGLPYGGPAASVSDGCLGRLGVGQPGADVRGVLVGAGDQLVA